MSLNHTTTLQPGQQEQNSISKKNRSEPALIHNQPLFIRWARSADLLRLGVRDQPDPRGKTQSLLKIQKLVGRGGACL